MADDRALARAREAAYRARNRDVLRERRRDYRERNADRVRAYEQSPQGRASRAAAAARWTERNPGYLTDWRRANPEKDRERHARRHARKRGATGSHTAEEITALAERQGHLCATPGCGASIREYFERDHRMPIALGGTDDIKNIDLLCQPCNRHKWAKHPDDWAREVAAWQR